MDSRPAIEGIRVVRRLAVGGMAEVFLGERQGCPVAVKRLLPGADEACTALFARERIVLDAVRDRHVVRLLAAGEGWLALEYVEGPDLASLLSHLGRRGRTLPVPAAMAVAEGLALGLSALHGAVGPDGRPLGVVHRDVNPSNLLVSQTGDVKVADLGVARVEGAGPTIDGLKGTLAYMAPEQLMGGRAEARSDLYGAGLVMWEVLAGVPARPPGSAGLAELMAARSRLPAPPSSVCPGLPEALDRAVLWALEPRPEDRPPDALSWWAALVAAGGEPDPAALGRAASEVEGGLRPVARTLAPGEVHGGGGPWGEAAGSAAAATGPGDARRSRRWPAVLAIGVAVAALVGWAAWPDLEPPGDLAPASLSSVSSAVPSPGAEVSSIAAAGPRVPEPVPAVAPPRPALRPALKPAGARGRADAPGASPAADRPPAPAPAASPAGLQVEIRPAGRQPTHVAGPGIRGLAPVRASLADGGTLLRLTGGAEGRLPALVRLVREGDRVTATVGAPEGRFYRVRCGGRDLGTTPVVGMAVDGSLECRLVTEGGDELAFGLARVAR